MVCARHALWAPLPRITSHSRLLRNAHFLCVFADDAAALNAALTWLTHTLGAGMAIFRRFENFAACQRVALILVHGLMAPQAATTGLIACCSRFTLHWVRAVIRMPMMVK